MQEGIFVTVVNGHKLLPTPGRGWRRYPQPALERSVVEPLAHPRSNASLQRRDPLEVNNTYILLIRHLHGMNHTGIYLSPVIRQR